MIPPNSATVIMIAKAAAFKLKNAFLAGRRFSFSASLPFDFYSFFPGVLPSGRKAISSCFFLLFSLFSPLLWEQSRIPFCPDFYSLPSATLPKHPLRI